jgi:hypothetical protein
MMLCGYFPSCNCCFSVLALSLLDINRNVLFPSFLRCPCKHKSQRSSLCSCVALCRHKSQRFSLPATLSPSEMAAAFFPCSCAVLRRRKSQRFFLFPCVVLSRHKSQCFTFAVCASSRRVSLGSLTAHTICWPVGFSRNIVVLLLHLYLIFAAYLGPCGSPMGVDTPSICFADM